MGRRILEALRERLGGRSPSTRVVLVGHSLGGAVALRILGDPELRRDFPDLVGRVDSAVLFAPLDSSAIERAYPEVRELEETPGFLVEVAEVLGILRRRTAEATRQTFSDPRRALREEADRFFQAFAHPAKFAAAKAMIRQCAAFDEDYHPIWDSNLAVETVYGNVSVPVLLVWGRRDELFPCSTGYMLRSTLPRAWLRVIPDAKHSVQHERPWRCTMLIRRFLQERGEGWTTVASLPPEDSRDDRPTLAERTTPEVEGPRP